MEDNSVDETHRLKEESVSALATTKQHQPSPKRKASRPSTASLRQYKAYFLAALVVACFFLVWGGLSGSKTIVSNSASVVKRPHDAARATSSGAGSMDRPSHKNRRNDIMKNAKLKQKMEHKMKAAEDEFELWKSDKIAKNLKQCMKWWGEKEKYYAFRRDNRIDQLNNHPEKYMSNDRWEAYQPETVLEMEMRVGNMASGGKFLVNPEHFYSNADCLVYSFGFNGYSFEEALSKATNRSCEIHIFDPELDDYRLQTLSETGRPMRIKFHKLGIAASASEDGVYNTFAGLREGLGHTGKDVSIVKVNCNYCEYEVLPQVFQALKDKQVEVGVIVADLHDMDREHTDALRQFWTNADSTDMRMYVRDPNVPYCEGHDCGEYAWISGKESFRSHVMYRCPEQYSEWESLYDQYGKP